MAENEGTTALAEEAQDEADETAATGTQPEKDEVTLLRSRTAGLDAKVTELTKAKKAAEQAAADAAKRLADYEAGTVSKDEALRAQLEAVKAEAEQARRDAALARIEAKYPETFAVLGDTAVSLSEDKLAEAEARFKGVAADEEPPKPRGNNPARSAGTAKPAGEETSDDIFAKLQSMDLPW